VAYTRTWNRIAQPSHGQSAAGDDDDRGRPRTTVETSSSRAFAGSRNCHPAKAHLDWRFRT
jgi:hypothetical protein